MIDSLLTSAIPAAGFPPEFPRWQTEENLTLQCMHYSDRCSLFPSVRKVTIAINRFLILTIFYGTGVTLQ
jgi:hypothetical protein